MLDYRVEGNFITKICEASAFMRPASRFPRRPSRFLPVANENQLDTLKFPLSPLEVIPKAIKVRPNSTLGVASSY